MKQIVGNGHDGKREMSILLQFGKAGDEDLSQVRNLCQLHFGVEN